MNACYADILDRIAEAPKWFDEHAVPRFDLFEPNKIANIYAYECALLLIACQSCGREFEVAMSRDAMDFTRGAEALAMQIAKKAIHYGDPPNVHCCASGPTMNCDDIRVLEYWHSDADTGHEWKREPSCEVSVADTQAEDD